MKVWVDKDGKRWSSLWRCSAICPVFVIPLPRPTVTPCSNPAVTLHETFFQFAVRARDNRDPERSADTTVVVKVNRNNENPKFQGQPYKTIVSENTRVGGSVIQVIARDRDIQVGHI